MKTTMSYLLTHIRMVSIEKIRDNKCWLECPKGTNPNSLDRSMSTLLLG